MSVATSYLAIFITILLTVYAQLMLKWRVSLAGLPPEDWTDKAKFYFTLLCDPWIMSTFVAAFLAALCWMTAMMKLDVNKAYPFMALNFILVGILAVPLLGETMTWQKLAGLGLVVIGLVVGGLA
jgi:drug/metabolite transporter (DMT)-like permease